METQTKISTALSSSANFKENSESVAFLTAPKLPDVFCVKTVPPCEPVSVNCPSEPGKLDCLDITQINEAIKATKLQPLSQDSMEQQTVSKEACKLFLKAAPAQEFHSYIKNANHSIENLTDNDQLETCDGQLLLTTSTSLENLVNSNLSNLQHCDCEKETEFEFCSVKQNTVEEFEFECGRCRKKVNLKSSIPVVKATTLPRSAIRNLVALSFLVNGQSLRSATQQVPVIDGVHRRHVGGQNKRKFVHKVCIKMAVNSQRRKIFLFLSTNMTAMMSHAMQTINRRSRNIMFHLECHELSSSSSSSPLC